jgi:hypothetical protein
MNKTEIAKIRLTKLEKQILVNEAKRLGITVSSIIRNTIIINPQPINKS